MSGRWARWVAWCAEREPTTPLALFRVAVGLCAVGELLGVWAAGVLPEVWVDQAWGGYAPLQPLPWLVEALGGARPEVVWPLFWSTLFAGVLLTLGLGGRLTALLVSQGLLALYGLNPAAGGGHDKLHLNALWLLVLAPSTTTLSLDCWLRTGGWMDDTPMPAWTRRLAVVQLATVYFTTGVQKISPEWTPAGGYSALYYALLSPSWQRWDVGWVGAVYPLTQLGTLVTWLWEVGGFLLFVPLVWPQARRWDLRLPYAALGAFFHLSLFALMNLGPFSWVTLAFYPCLWTHAEWARGWARLRGRPQGGSG